MAKAIARDQAELISRLPIAGSSARDAVEHRPQDRRQRARRHVDHPIVALLKPASASVRVRLGGLALVRRHEVDDGPQRKRDEVGEYAAPIGVCRLKPWPAKRRSLTSASHSARSASVGLRRKQPRKPAHRPALAGTCLRLLGEQRRSASASAPSSTPPRAGPLRPSAIAMMTPCRVWMSCCVGCMRLKMLRRLISMVARFSGGRKNSTFSSSRSRLSKNASSCCLRGRRRFLRHRERQRAAGRELEPFVADDQHRLREIERGEGRIDRQRDDRVGEPDLVVLEPPALAPEQQRDVLAGRDARRHLRAAASGARPRASPDRARAPSSRARTCNRRSPPPRVSNSFAASSTRSAPEAARRARGFGQPSRGLTSRSSRQAEIRHRARGRADVLAELRLDQNHDRRRRLRPSAWSCQFRLPACARYSGMQRARKVVASSLPSSLRRRQRSARRGPIAIRAVSKDGPAPQRSFETHRFTMLLRMRPAKGLAIPPDAFSPSLPVL